MTTIRPAAAGKPHDNQGRRARLVLDSLITCPDCTGQWLEDMPTDRLQTICRCPGCGIELHPASGTCCVYCTYGSEPCPLVQAIEHCCRPPPLIGLRAG